MVYGAVFCIGVPALLAWWSRQLEAKSTALPHLQSIPAGLAVGLAGAALLLRGMWDLLRTGGGLPMNAFPPPRLVDSGAYRWIAHPIYVGFGAIVAGVALATGSAAGLWIVTPVTWLGLVALVIGYERIDLARRFGRCRGVAWLAWPADEVTAPRWRERTAAAVLAFGPWLLGYAFCVPLTGGRNDLDTTLPFERGWLVAEWTAVFYLGAYAWTAAAPFVAREQRALRWFVRTSVAGSVLIVWCFLTLPFMAQPRLLDPATLAGRLLTLDRTLDSAGCAFPSFHVFWAFAAASVWASRIGRVPSLVVATLIAGSCLSTGVHSLLDVIAGWLAFVAARRCDVIWEALRDGAERAANSWRDWRAGPFRIINHGVYVAAAATLGVWLAGMLLGPTHAAAVVVVALCALVGAGAWGQWLEASSQLSRPFGYFGGLFGGCLGVVAAEVAWGSGWLVAGAFAIAAPVIQSFGRLRCLVQGCCHGSVTELDWLGIRYTQPLSRVCRLARLGGMSLHPTPLYSILANVVLFGLLARLWREGADMALVVGGYFVLSMLARFVEEGYRGEPQTVRFGGLPIYQWLAIACVLTGIGLTTLPAPPPPAWDGISFAPLAYAVPIGLLVWFAMGVDFPESHRRMSRLA